MATSPEESESASHPPYPDMILAAITELGDKKGSSKLAISRKIQATYIDSLQMNHSAMLSETLNNLKDSGKLLFFKKKYLMLDNSAEMWSGRGHPPNLQPDLPEASKRPLPKKRMRSSNGNKRGHKPKEPKTNSDSASTSARPKRGRGRPPMESTSTADPLDCDIWWDEEAIWEVLKGE